MTVDRRSIPRASPLTSLGSQSVAMGEYGLHFWMSDISRYPGYVEGINSHSFEGFLIFLGVYAKAREWIALPSHRYCVGYGGMWGRAEGGSSLPRTCGYYQSDHTTLRLPADHYASKGIPRTPIYTRFYLMLHEMSLRQGWKLHLPIRPILLHPESPEKLAASTQRTTTC